MNRTGRVALASLALMLGLVPAMVAWAAGDLDTSFSGDGYVVFRSESGFSWASGLALDDTGGGVLVGSANDRPAALRFDGAGEVVDGFLSGGGNPLEGRYPTATLLLDGVWDDQGRLLVAAVGSHAAGDIIVARLEGDGVVDASFGVDGVVEVPIMRSTGEGSADTSLDVDSQGRIVVFGLHADGSFAVARIDATGVMDSAFGDAGTFTHDLGVDDATPRGMALDATDRIVLVGSAGSAAVAMRVDGGNLDVDFADGGILLVESPYPEYAIQASDVVVHPAGDIFIIGDMEALPVMIAVDESGDPVPGVGDGGVALDMDLLPRWFIPERMALDGRGGFVATGIGGSSAVIDTGVLRYAMDGTRDEGFGVDGLAPSPFVPGEAMGFGMDIGVGPDGSITVAGQLVTPGGESGWTDDMGAIRYTPGSVLTSASTTSSSSSTTTASVPSPSSTTTTTPSATSSSTLPATPPTTMPEVPSPDSFSDDDGSAFEDDIEWLAASGITSGCNPPLNDLFCPDAEVTRGQMAAFLVRALGLTSLGSFEFIDDDASVFETDIEKLAEAGVTRGCNPPANTLFCPEDVVTRGQMAAFLHRAWPDLPLGLEPVQFDDVTGSVFASDIEWLARTGVTRGCSETSFCPEAPVTRGQMAAFLRRALGS